MTFHASGHHAFPSPAFEFNTLAKLQAALEPHRGKPLIFSYAGRQIASGYHVTEVKAALLSSIDCGGAPEEWHETVIQLWDVPQEGATHMTAGKFMGILAQVTQRLERGLEGHLFFEVGDSARAMQLFTTGSVANLADHIAVDLEPRRATCKPLERGLQLAAPDDAACCGTTACCG
jgi:Family of unknown function (DUF6428)